MKFVLLMTVSVCVFGFTLAAKKLRSAQAQTVLQLQLQRAPAEAQEHCKVKTTKDLAENGGYKDDTDVDLYYKSLHLLIENNKLLTDNGVQVEHIIPNSGSGTYWYGCPHSNHPEVGALDVNDLDGMCISAECDKAFEAERVAKATFFRWKQERDKGGLVFEAEVFNAKIEATGPHGKFGKDEAGKDQEYHWKQGMLELYAGANKVTPTPITSEINKHTINVPDCASMCLFKRVMLNGTPVQRKDAKDGPGKLRQDLLDLKCLMQKCELDHECKHKPNAAMPKDLAGVAYGPTADGKSNEAKNPPYAEDLVKFMGKNEYINHPPAGFPCRALNGMGDKTGTLNSMENIRPVDVPKIALSDHIKAHMKKLANRVQLGVRHVEGIHDHAIASPNDKPEQPKGTPAVIKEEEEKPKHPPAELKEDQTKPEKSQDPPAEKKEEKPKGGGYPPAEKKEEKPAVPQKKT